MLISWEEGAGTNTFSDFPGILGVGAQPGEVCWNFRAWPDVPWGAPGGAAGVDYATNISGLISGIGNDRNETYAVNSIEGRIEEDLQLWLDQPHLNHGWMMKGANEHPIWTAKRFLADEFYPRIEVEFIPPPRIQNLQLTNGRFRFQFEAQAGQPYTVQYRDSLTTGSWLTLTNVPAPPEEPVEILVIDPSPATQTNRLYRVMAD